MYDELVKRLIEASKVKYGQRVNVERELLAQTADAFEELSHDYEKLAEDFNGAVELLHKRSKPRWIPVTERLPEKFENVIVANKRGKHYDIDKAWWNGSYFDRCAKGSYNNVTHWMPLLEPPKEE